VPTPPMTHYDVLGVAPTATADEVRRAFHRLAKQWHPDRNQDNPAAAEARFREIQQAWETLGDAEQRGEYDLNIGLRRRRRRPRRRGRAWIVSDGEGPAEAWQLPQFWLAVLGVVFLAVVAGIVAWRAGVFARREAGPAPALRPAVRVEFAVLDGLCPEGLRFVEVAPSGGASVREHLFRELPFDTRPVGGGETTSGFRAAVRPDGSGVVETYRVRHPGTGEVFEIGEVAITRGEDGAWELAETGRLRIREALEAELGCRLRAGSP